MGEYEWLLFLHVTGAFLLLGGALAAAILNVAALRRERPSEIALLLGLTRFAVIPVVLGLVLTIVFGLWLVHHVPGYSYGQAWVVGAIVLWIVGTVTGEAGGRRERKTRELAERLAGKGAAVTPELRARLADPAGRVLSYASGLAILGVLVLMVWKPGAP